MAITPHEALQRTIEHREIFHDEMLSLMRQIMAGELSPLMTAAIITGLRVKKETIGEITAAAHGVAIAARPVMRSRSLPRHREKTIARLMSITCVNRSAQGSTLSQHFGSVRFDRPVRTGKY